MGKRFVIGISCLICSGSVFAHVTFQSRAEALTRDCLAIARQLKGLPGKSCFVYGFKPASIERWWKMLSSAQKLFAGNKPRTITAESAALFAEGMRKPRLFSLQAFTAVKTLRMLGVGKKETAQISMPKVHETILSLARTLKKELSVLPDDLKKSMKWTDAVQTKALKKFLVMLYGELMTIYKRIVEDANKLILMQNITQKAVDTKMSARKSENISEKQAPETSSVCLSRLWFFSPRTQSLLTSVA